MFTKPLLLKTFENNFSALFDGVDEYIDWGNIANFERTQPFSVVAIIKTAGAAGGIISRRGGTPAFKGWEFNNIAGQLEFNLTNNAAINNRIRIRTAANTFNNNNHYHAVVTYDGSSLASGIKIYVNGSSETLDPPIVDNLTASILVSIDCNVGARNNGENFWNGIIDEPAIYNKELSAAEITKIYNSGKVKDLRRLATKANLYSWLRFTQTDIDNFPTIFDYSDNGRNGTAINMEAGDIQGDVA